MYFLCFSSFRMYVFYASFLARRTLHTQKKKKKKKKKIVTGSNRGNGE